MSTDGVAAPGEVQVTPSGRDGLSVTVRADSGAFYSYHLYRGTKLVEASTYVPSDGYVFGGLGPGTYRCRVFIRTVEETRFVLGSDRFTIPATEDPGPASAADADPRWSPTRDLPRDSDYAQFLPAVTRWGSVEDFVRATDWPPGVQVIGLASGLHIDLYLGGDLRTIEPGRGLPVIFSGAVSKRSGNPGPFFSGIGLGKSVNSPFLAISDATLNTDRELTLSWYAGRTGDSLQEATLALLTAVQQRFDRELLLVGGSGGGFASLFNAARLDVPVSAFVWNAQTDLLNYQPRAVAQYLTQALAMSHAAVAALSKEDRSRALRAGGVEHRVVPDRPGLGRRRLLFLQNAGDIHVIDHTAPFVTDTGLRHVGGGRYVDDNGALVLVSDFSDGHNPPPREVLVRALRALLDVSSAAADVADSLQTAQLLPDSGLETLPRDLRVDAESLRGRLALRATRDEAGRLHAAITWDGLPNRFGGISTAFDFSGTGEPFTRSHRQNGIVIDDPEGKVEQVTARVRDGLLNELFQLNARVTPDPRRLRTYVVGSCVSRDTFAFLDPSHFELGGYLARQSLISAFGPTARVPIDPALLTSPFQRRMLESDADSSIPGALRAAAQEIDLLLWDLVDERLGVLDHPDGGVSTDSVELRTQLHGDLPSGLTRTEFGTPEHLDRFAAALPPWRDLLAELGLLSRTVIVAPPWAALDTSGAPTPTSFGLDAGKANHLAEAYLAAAAEALGVEIVGRDLAPRASMTHQWGIAPFHYDDATYEELATEISAAAQRLCQPFGWGEGDPHSRTRVPSLAQRRPGHSSTQTATVTLTQTGPLEVTATVIAPGMQACAFALHVAGQRLSLTPYQRTTTHSFTVARPAVYRCRVFVLYADGSRVPSVSAPLRVR